MCTFDSLRCGGFEALKARGYLWASVTNTGAFGRKRKTATRSWRPRESALRLLLCAELTAAHHSLKHSKRQPGTVAASYTLSLTNCSVGIGPVEALRLALEPNATVDVTPFQVGCCFGSGRPLPAAAAGGLPGP
jgi:hypothetical protein